MAGLANAAERWESGAGKLESDAGGGWENGAALWGTKAENLQLDASNKTNIFVLHGKAMKQYDYYTWRPELNLLPLLLLRIPKTSESDFPNFNLAD